jgi:hypothetical protein
MAITTDRDAVRLLIGDTDTDDELFQDDEIAFFLAERADDVYLAAADACDAAARKFARAYDFTTDGQSFHRSQMSKAYLALAKDLRLRAAGGLTTLVPTRVDGYSDDVAADEVQTATRPAGRRGYYRVGLPDIP